LRGAAFDASEKATNRSRFDASIQSSGAKSCDSIDMTHIHLADRNDKRLRKPARPVLAAGLFGWRKPQPSNEDDRKDGGAPGPR